MCRLLRSAEAAPHAAARPRRQRAGDDTWWEHQLRRAGFDMTQPSLSTSRCPRHVFANGSQRERIRCAAGVCGGFASRHAAPVPHLRTDAVRAPWQSGCDAQAADLLRLWKLRTTAPACLRPTTRLKGCWAEFLRHQAPCVGADSTWYSAQAARRTTNPTAHAARSKFKPTNRGSTSPWEALRDICARQRYAARVAPAERQRGVRRWRLLGRPPCANAPNGHAKCCSRAC